VASIKKRSSKICLSAFCYESSLFCNKILAGLNLDLSRRSKMIFELVNFWRSSAVNTQENFQLITRKFSKTSPARGGQRGYIFGNLFGDEGTNFSKNVASLTPNIRSPALPNPSFVGRCRCQKYLGWRWYQHLFE
jgi:hypothetical protein